ncbi:MAG: TolC family protein [Bacteroidota bacterium]
MMHRFLWVLLAIPGWVAADDADSVSVAELPWQVYMNRVYRYHPVAEQLRLQPAMAEAMLMETKGAFDPKIASDYIQKDFEDKDYFRRWDTDIKVPVWNYADLKLGYEQNQGIYLNPEAEVPDDGLIYAGISIPVGRGLFIDSRRAAIKKAILELDGNEAERQKNMNKFLLMSAKAYWEWAQAHQQLLLAEEGVRLAAFRLSGTRQNVTQGAAAAVDTLEAGLQLRSRRLDYQQAQLDYQTALLYLETFLWDNVGEPLQLQPGIVPEVVPPTNSLPMPSGLDSLVALVDVHPELVKYQIKGEQLVVDRRLALENLKPELNLEYNWLWPPSGNPQNIVVPFSNDYKWGANFSIPLLYRKERGKLNQIRIKAEQNSLDQDNIFLQLENEIRQRYVQFQQFEQMLAQATIMSDEYAQLLAAERIRFDNGESSLFLVNSREVKYLDARKKQIDLEAKLSKALAELWERAGVLEVLWLDQAEAAPAN